MARRFELGIGPLFSRMGYVRPDLEPLPSSDDVQPVVIVGNFANAAISPDSRVLWQTGRITSAEVLALGPGRFATMQFFPPSAGAYLRSIYSSTEAGSYSTLYTTNQVGFPGVFAGGGSTQRPLRPDDREPYVNVPTPQVGAATTLGGFTRLTSVGFGPPMPFWVGTNIVVQCTTADEGTSVTLEFECPLEGMQRSG